MWAPAVPRRRGPRRSPTEEEILDAALGLLDDGGPDAASVRGIAARVGVAPDAVYIHFPGKAAVIQALVERLLDGVDHDVLEDPRRHRIATPTSATEVLVSGRGRHDGPGAGGSPTPRRRG
jgi:AcrR family transcriptional regulator